MVIDIYGQNDPRDIPTYSISDAARYLRIPAGTIRSWVAGRNYPTARGSKKFEPIIEVKNIKPQLLSFTNLVEIHVLRAIRKHHMVQLDKVRSALDYIDQEFKTLHPLATEKFRTDGVNLFIERYGSLINVSTKGQLELQLELKAHLERIKTDQSGFASQLFPFTRTQEDNNPELVVLDPQVSYGRLVVAGTGIPTKVLAERYQAGESIDELAHDYDCRRLTIEEAIRCEMPVAA